jgi:hypothetical protein
MQLEHFALRFEKLSESLGLKYSLGEPTSESDVSQTAANLGVSFPAQVVLFYKYFNGLRVENPPLEVLPIERLNFAFPNRLHFATFDGNRCLFFDTSHINNAEQWDVVTKNGFCVTLTMASFWSNKIWAWVERKRAIWEEHPEAKRICGK